MSTPPKGIPRLQPWEEVNFSTTKLRKKNHHLPRGEP
jgi:hypothetical protein